jgi:hypothetical protein
MKRILILALMIFSFAPGAFLASTGQNKGGPPPPPPPTHMGTGRRIWKPMSRTRHGHHRYHRGRKRDATLLQVGKDW